MSDEVRFEDPPPRGITRWRAKGHHESIAAQLRAQPNEWAAVDLRATPRSAASMAYGIRAAKLAAYEPVGAFEAQARTVNGEFRVYARFVGEATNE